MKHETRQPASPTRKEKMPNHCSNYLGVSGPSDEVRRFHAGLNLEQENAIGICRTYWPMPEVLGDTRSPAPKPGDTSHWDKLLADGDIDQSRYDELVARHTADIDKMNTAKNATGHTDWYSWALDNWGTKWGDYDTWESGTSDHEDGTLEYRYNFTTAWGPCDIAIRNISTLFPTLMFELTYSEEGMCFAGGDRFQNGNHIAHVYYEGDSFPSYDETEDDEPNWQKFSDDLSDLMSRIEDELAEGVFA